MIVPECPAAGNSCLEHGAMACSLARNVRVRLVGMQQYRKRQQLRVHAQTTVRERPKRLCGGAPALPLPESQQQAQSRSPAWLESQRVARLDGRPQTPDLVPPSRDEAVELGVLAVVPHTALAER